MQTKMHSICCSTLLLFLYGKIFLLVLGKTNLTDIYILGLFPMEDPVPGGLGIKPAVDVAINYVNGDVSMLPGYRLNMIWNNTKCFVGRGVDILTSMLCINTTFIMILGPGCSSVSQVVAQAAPLWNLVQVSYISTSVALSNKKKFPLFFRVICSERKLNYARVALLKHFNWTRVTVISDSSELFSEMLEDIHEYMCQHEIKVDRMLECQNDAKKCIRMLQKHDARIILSGWYPDKARRLLCEAYKLGFFGPKIVWILPSFFIYGWWESNDTDCTADQILLAVGNYFSVNIFLTSDDTKPDDNGITLRQFRKDYEQLTNSTRHPGYFSAPDGYDALWVIARALNATLADLKNIGYGLEDFNYTQNYMSELIKNNTSKVNFSSISGQVAFDENGESTKILMIEQFQDGKIVVLAWYNELQTDNKLTWNNSTHVLWINGKVPKDSMRTVTKLMILSRPLYIIMCTVAAFGIVMATIFLIFNIKYRNTRLIKMSSPDINNLMLLGCVTLYTYVFVEGLDIRMSPAACPAKVFLLIIGFSLVFAPLFAKTYRVYAIFTASKKLRKQVVKNFQLFSTVAVFTVINLGMLVIWVLLDPSKPVEIKLNHMKVEDHPNDLIVIPVVTECKSSCNSYFDGVFIIIQAILLVLGVFLAITTRNVMIPALNDSKPIAMCIYIVVILSTLGIPVEFVVHDINITYGLTSTLIIAGTSITQCLIFVPKVKTLKKFLKGDDSQCRTSVVFGKTFIIPYSSSGTSESEETPNSLTR